MAGLGVGLAPVAGLRRGKRRAQRLPIGVGQRLRARRSRAISEREARAHTKRRNTGNKPALLLAESKMRPDRLRVFAGRGKLIA